MRRQRLILEPERPRPASHVVKRVAKTGDGIRNVATPDLSVLGHSCTVYDDPVAAHELDSERHLISWTDGAKVPTEVPPRVDRFDGRNLIGWKDLEAEPDDDAQPGHVDAEGYSEEDLFNEQFRYLSEEAGGLGHLPEDDEEDESEEEYRPGQLKLPPKGAYSAMTFDYSSEAPRPGRTKDRDRSDAPRPVELDETKPNRKDPFAVDFLIPKGMVTPHSMKHHGIIAKTADRLRKRPQNAVLVLLNEKDNPWYEFLREGHPLHPYYVFLREYQPHHDDADEKDDAAEKPGGGLGALLGDYDSDSDASDSGASASASGDPAQAEALDEDLTNILEDVEDERKKPANSDSDEDGDEENGEDKEKDGKLQKAIRLAKARALRERFLKQMGKASKGEEAQEPEADGTTDEARQEEAQVQVQEVDKTEVGKGEATKEHKGNATTDEEAKEEDADKIVARLQASNNRAGSAADEVMRRMAKEQASSSPAPPDSSLLKNLLAADSDDDGDDDDDDHDEGKDGGSEGKKGGAEASSGAGAVEPPRKRRRRSRFDMLTRSPAAKNNAAEATGEAAPPETDKVVAVSLQLKHKKKRKRKSRFGPMIVEGFGDDADDADDAA